MSKRSQNPAYQRRERIRKRDQKRYKLRLVCTLCNEICQTERHHFQYRDRYDPRAIIEVCKECHDVLDDIKHAKDKHRDQIEGI